MKLPSVLSSLGLLSLLSLGSAQAQERVLTYLETVKNTQICLSGPPVEPVSLVAPVSLVTTNTTTVRYRIRKMRTTTSDPLMEGVVEFFVVGGKKYFKTNTPPSGNLNSLVLNDLKDSTYELRSPSGRPMHMEVTGNTTLVANPEEPIATSSTDFVKGQLASFFLPKSVYTFVAPTTLKGAGRNWSVQTAAKTIPSAYKETKFCENAWSRTIQIDLAASDLANSGENIGTPTDPNPIIYTNKTIAYGAAVVISRLQRMGYNLAPSNL